MARRHRKRRAQGDVELNLAAMLDMAFQLLTFFILTFKPAPVEGQIELHMPPPQPLAGKGVPAGSDERNKDPVKGLSTIVISVYSKKSGDINSMGIGSSNSPDSVSLGANMGRLNDELHKLLSDKGSPFDQVLIQVGSGVHYGPLMKVVEVCAAQKLADGSKLKQLNFIEIPETAAPPPM